MASTQGRLDKVYQNKPKLFRLNQMPNNNPMTNNFMIGYPPPQPFMQQQYMPYPYSQNQMFDPTYGAQFQNQNMNQFPTQTIQMNQIQEQEEPINSNSESNNNSVQNNQQTQKLKMSFDTKNMPPPPPPPPEMIKALTQLLQSGQNYQTIQQTVPFIPPQVPSMLPQSLLRSSNRIKLTSHLYKNQNASQDPPLNPKFIKTGKTQKDTNKERLYQPNTGYIIDEENEQQSKKDNKENDIKIFIRGEDDLIQSGVTTERDEDDDQMHDLTQAEKKFVNQKFLMHESISESQFKEHVPKIYIDPSHACQIEEQKIIEKEKEEEEFQKKKEVFLMKNKYKLLVELEKEKSRKLMEKLLKKDLDNIEAKNREQEILNQLEGEEIRKQKNQTKELEKIILDIRQERDYKTIKKVLGINLEKPIDQVIDFEKIKAEYVIEEMYKKNQELFEQADKLFEECNYYVDDKGQQHDDFKDLDYNNLAAIEKYSRKSYIIQDEEDNYNQEEFDEDNDESDQEIQKSVKFVRNNSLLAQSQLADSQLLSARKSQVNDRSSVMFQFPSDRNISNSSKVRFEKEKQYQLTEEEKKQRDFYLSIQKKIYQAEQQLKNLCDYDSDISIDITGNKQQKKESNSQKNSKQQLKQKNNLQATQKRSQSSAAAKQQPQANKHNNATLKKGVTVPKKK